MWRVLFVTWVQGLCCCCYLEYLGYLASSVTMVTGQLMHGRLLCGRGFEGSEEEGRTWELYHSNVLVHYFFKTPDCKRSLCGPPFVFCAPDWGGHNTFYCQCRHMITQLWFVTLSCLTCILAVWKWVRRCLKMFWLHITKSQFMMSQFKVRPRVRHLVMMVRGRMPGNALRQWGCLYEVLVCMCGCDGHT